MWILASYIWGIFLAYAWNLQLLLIFTAHLSDLEDLPAALPFFFIVLILVGITTGKRNTCWYSLLTAWHSWWGNAAHSFLAWYPSLPDSGLNYGFKIIFKMVLLGSPSPASFTFSLPAFAVEELSRCSCCLCCVCRNWCVAVSCLQHWGCASPELSTLGTLSLSPGLAPMFFWRRIPSVGMLCLHGIPLYLLLLY